MGTFRLVYTEFWKDEKIVEMTPEDKYFYLYLLTNPNTNSIGIYKILRKQMAFDLGYSIEAINSLMDRFINYHKLIKYDEQSKEICVIKFGKYNLNKGGRPVECCVLKNLQDVSNKTFIVEILNHIQYEPMKKLFIKFLEDAKEQKNEVNYYSLLKIEEPSENATSDDTSTTRDTYRGETINHKPKTINHINNIYSPDEVEETEIEKTEPIKNQNSLSSIEDDTYREIIDYLNKKANTRYKHTTQKTRKHINARIKEGYDIDDFKTVIDNKTASWLGTDYEQYLRPETLFGTKFEGYLNEKPKYNKFNTTQRSYTTNVTNKAAKEATTIYNTKSDYVPDYKKNYDAKSHNPKGHDNFEISSDMQKFTTDENYANDMERKLLGWDDYDESENPYMN